MILRLTPRAWLGLVLAIALVERLGLWLLYAPIPYNDTPSYRRLAETLLQGFARYDGTRTPGYPLILAVFGSDQHVWLAQMGMGLGVTLLLFYIGWQLSGRAWFGGLAALAHTLSLQQLFFEADLLSETASTFWVIVTLAGTVLWLCRPERRSIWLACGLGLSASIAWLTRPLFIYLPFWGLLFLLLPDKRWEGWKQGLADLISYSLKPPNLTRILFFLLPVVLAFGGWLGFIRARYHMWALTTMTGFHMVQHTGVFFEYVPDQYAALRDTYLKYREAHIAEYGSQANTIWEAIPEMQKVSGKSFYDLSRLLAQISTRLILEHPDLYLKNVIQGWGWFWRPPVYWSLESFRWQAVVPALQILALAQRAALFGANLIFIVTSLIAALWPRARRAWKLNPALWHIAGSIWIASILQTILDHGDNVRFLVPMQSMVVVWVLWVGMMAVASFKPKNGQRLART